MDTPTQREQLTLTQAAEVVMNALGAAVVYGDRGSSEQHQPGVILHLADSSQVEIHSERYWHERAGGTEPRAFRYRTVVRITVERQEIPDYAR